MVQFLRSPVFRQFMAIIQRHADYTS